MPSKFANRAETAKLTAEGAVLLEAARQWLAETEPEYFAKYPQAVPHTAMTALANAEAARVASLPAQTRGHGWVNALAHAVAILVLQQDRPAELVYVEFGKLVGAKVQELMLDGVSDHMVGASLETQGRG